MLYSTNFLFVMCIMTTPRPQCLQTGIICHCSIYNDLVNVGHYHTCYFNMLNKINSKLFKENTFNMFL